MILEALLCILANTQTLPQEAVLVIGASLRTNATDTLKIKQLGRKLVLHVLQRWEILQPFIQRRKMILFINLAMALKKISGLEQMTMIRTGHGSGETAQTGAIPTGPV